MERCKSILHHSSGTQTGEERRVSFRCTNPLEEVVGRAFTMPLVVRRLKNLMLADRTMRATVSRGFTTSEKDQEYHARASSSEESRGAGEQPPHH